MITQLCFLKKVSKTPNRVEEVKWSLEVSFTLRYRVGGPASRILERGASKGESSGDLQNIPLQSSVE